MSVSEQERHELYVAMESVIGTERATTMMSLLPPAGWGDVATRRDLDDLEHRFEAKLERGLREQTRTVIFSLLASQATLTASIVAAVSLLS